MDVSSVKAKTVTDTTASTKPKSTAEQLMGDFSAAVAQRMSKSGQGLMENTHQTGFHGGVNIKNDVASQENVKPKQTETAVRDDAPVRERAEPAPQNHDDYARPVESKDDAPQDTMRRNDEGNETAAQDSNNDTPNHKNAKSDTSSQNDEGGNTEQAQSDGDGETVETAEATGQGGGENIQTDQTQAALAAVVDGVNQNGSNKGAEVQQAAVQGTQKVQEVATNTNTTSQNTDGGEDGIDVDLANLAGQKKDGANVGQQQTQTNTGQQQAQTNMGQKVDGQHTLQHDGSLKQQQAADLASKVGEGQKVDVNVNVTKQSEKLVSQPTANLGAQAAMADDGETLTQTTTQASTKPVAANAQAAASHNLGNQNGQQGGDAQQQAQQQMQMAQAEAAKNVGNTDNKNQTTQAINANATSAIAKAGGAESASNSHGLNQPNATQTQQQATAQAKTNTTPQAQTRAQVTEQVNVQIQKAIAGGMDKINIQLKPAHLGRVDIQLEMGNDGRVTAVVSADNKDTLDLLKQDSRELERAMREAGLQMNSGDLSFNLRENGNQEGEQQAADGGPSMGPLTNEPTLEELLEASAGRPQIISDDRVDITA